MKEFTNKLRKSLRTKDLILTTAIAMFQEIGYEATTMRSIAARCGVALGNAYYYFQSKEHLVLELYMRTLHEQLEACIPVLLSTKSIKKRLSGVVLAQLGALEPYRPVLRSLFRFGADPASPLNPFGPQSAEIRQGAQELFRNVVENSKEQVPADIKGALPYCLWLYSMGVILFWLHDTSAEQRKTKRLVELTSDLILSFILLTSMPMLKPFRLTLLKLIDEFRLDDAHFV
jgi:AcrR family transcriptional regulator